MQEVGICCKPKKGRNEEPCGTSLSLTGARSLPNHREDQSAEISDRAMQSLWPRWIDISISVTLDTNGASSFSDQSRLQVPQHTLRPGRGLDRYFVLHKLRLPADHPSSQCSRFFTASDWSQTNVLPLCVELSSIISLSVILSYCRRLAL